MDTMIRIKPAAARVNAGKTQKEVAAHLHVTINTIVAWENFKSEPTISQARSMADFYNIPLDCIIFMQPKSN